MSLRQLAAGGDWVLEGNGRGWRLQVYDPLEPFTLTRANACAQGLLLLGVPVGEGWAYRRYAAPEEVPAGYGEWAAKAQALWSAAAAGAA